MKNYGNIINYEGISGYIKGDDGIKYLLLDKNIILKEKTIEPNDPVEFEPINIKSPEVEVNIATFVKVLKKK